MFNPASPENKFHDWRRSLSSAWWWRNSGLTDIVKPPGNDSNLLIVFYVQIMPDDFVMQLHRF
ncbi:hypothetical protein AWP59_04065 [Escherichia coli]|nr:hypothetical protein AWP59_04065 [Escherichia coli]